jgi:hypothetical protein
MGSRFILAGEQTASRSAVCLYVSHTACTQKSILVAAFSKHVSEMSELCRGD